MSRNNPLRDPAVFGTMCGLLSSVGYTLANVCLRAVSHCDPIWVSCIKAFPTMLLVGPWLIARASRGERILPPWRVLAAIVMAGVFGQLVGNVAFQWSLGIVGLALDVPLSLGAMIVTGPILGRIVLGEPITFRGAASIGVLLIAVFVLSLGTRGNTAQPEMENGAGVSWLILAAGIGAACLSGVAYAVLGVVIRHSVTGHASLSTTLVTVSIVGILGLGTMSYFRIGPDQMRETTIDDLAMMLLAGVCNAGAFLALTKALQLTPVVYVNALNATQAGMAFLAGSLIFWEPITRPMLVGLALTMFGLLIMRGKKRPAEPVELLAETPPAAE